jgi:hypothetical protein
MELIERLPIDKIKFLNTMKYADFKNYAKSSCKNEEERIKQFDMMKSFCATNIKCRGEVKRIYSYTQTTPLEVGGRLYCGNSLQSIPKKIRGFLLKDIATDIDMKNAHPVILRYLCKINKIHCPELEYYCNHRDEILDAGDRDKIKTMYLCAVNTDEINKKTKDTNFKKFDKECKEIQKKLTSLECYKHIVDTVPASRNYNWLGSAINRILCVYENRILQEVINFLNKKQIEILGTAFDGLLMYGNYYDDVDMLVEINLHIESKFSGLNMQFDYKEHDDELEMPDNDNEQSTWVEVENDKTYESVKEQFEKAHCKITNKAMFFKKFENKIIPMKKEQMKIAYQNMKYEEVVDVKGELKIVKKSFIEKWFDDEDMECRDEVGVFPTGLTCPSNYYNMWSPFDMELITEYTNNQEAVDLFRKHIKILCGNEDVVADYFEKWIAQMIQYPAIKTVCPTLISREGAGKGTLMQLLTKMLGSNKVFETTQPSRDVWGDFNGLMSEAFLVNLNELSKKETVESNGKIKGLITDDTLKINNKGFNQFPIKSFHRFIITTNNEEPVDTNKDDRRKFIVRSSDELCGNKEYFKKMYELLADENVIKSCYEYFKSIPNMDDFASIEMPVTEYHNELKEMSENIIERWCREYTQENFNKTIIEEKSIDIYASFMKWCDKCKTNYVCDYIKFATRFNRLKIKGVSTKKTKICNYTVFDIEELKKTFSLGCLISVKNDTDIEEEEEEDFDM